jgi:hypothetical protein
VLLIVRGCGWSWVVVPISCCGGWSLFAVGAGAKLSFVGFETTCDTDWQNPGTHIMGTG